MVVWKLVGLVVVDLAILSIHDYYYIDNFLKKCSTDADGPVFKQWREPRGLGI